MKKVLIFSLFFWLFLIPSNAYAEEKTYILTIDEHTFDIVYEVDANVLAMAIDQELISLLVGLENTKDSQFTINFPKEMLSAENDEFAILVNGLEVEYEIFQDSNDYALVFYVPEETQEVEIIGTHVIPEFPIGALFGLALITSIAITLRNFRLFR
jgi:hypothetical protein